jgi:hypothetical protein
MYPGMTNHAGLADLLNKLADRLEALDPYESGNRLCHDARRIARDLELAEVRVLTRDDGDRTMGPGRLCACEGCDSEARAGFVGERLSFCFEHMLAGLLDELDGAPALRRAIRACRWKGQIRVTSCVRESES